MKSRMVSKGVNPSKLGRWLWVRIRGKAGESTIFVSAYRPCKNTNGVDTVWKQHVRYYQDEREIKDLADLWDSGHHVVLSMNANDDVRDGAVSAVLAEIVLRKL